MIEQPQHTGNDLAFLQRFDFLNEASLCGITFSEAALQGPDPLAIINPVHVTVAACPTEINDSPTA
jgi:hypothetical protein